MASGFRRTRRMAGTAPRARMAFKVRATPPKNCDTSVTRAWHTVAPVAETRAGRMGAQTDKFKDLSGSTAGQHLTKKRRKPFPA